MRRLPRIGLWAALALLYAWPALLNRGPFFFPDTSHYIRAADAAVVSLTGHRSIWSDRLLEAPAAPAADAARRDAASPPGAEIARSGTTTIAPQIRPARTVLTGRSIYYGAFLYAGLEGFGRFGPVFFQSAIAVGTVALFLLGATASLAPRRRQRWIWGGLLAVGLLSALPFFVSRLMPGAFTGPLILAFVSLILFGAQYGRLARAFLFVVAAAAITFHISHILLILSVGGGALLLNLDSGRAGRSGFCYRRASFSSPSRRRCSFRQR